MICQKWTRAAVSFNEKSKATCKPLANDKEVTTVPFKNW